jgi:hypothetical protein
MRNYTNLNFREPTPLVNVKIPKSINMIDFGGEMLLHHTPKIKNVHDIPDHVFSIEVLL